MLRNKFRVHPVILFSQLVLVSFGIPSISCSWLDIGTFQINCHWVIQWILIYIMVLLSFLLTTVARPIIIRKFGLSTPLINQICVYHSPTDAAPQFLQKLIPFTQLLLVLLLGLSLLFFCYFLQGCAVLDRFHILQNCTCVSFLSVLGSREQCWKSSARYLL